MSLITRLTQWAEAGVGAHEAADVVVTKTTRYLRLSMVGLVVALTVSVLYEHSKSVQRDGIATGHCWQRSISAYYYTPSQSVFVAALVAVGVSLIALKGSTELEDVLLNFAGILAPVVAFVPTASAGTCRSVALITTNRNENIANNVTALLVCGGVALTLVGLGAAVCAVHRRRRQGVAISDRAWVEPIALIGYVGAVGLYVAALVAFLGWRTWFIDHAHTTAATVMFGFIFLTVLDNAINFYFTRRRIVETQALDRGERPRSISRPRAVNRYAIIAGLMVIAAVVIGLSGWFGDYRTLWLEASMISLFAAFWVLQTIELWDFGLRGPTQPVIDRN